MVGEDPAGSERGDFPGEGCCREAPGQALRWDRWAFQTPRFPYPPPCVPTLRVTPLRGPASQRPDHPRPPRCLCGPRRAALETGPEQKVLEAGARPCLSGPPVLHGDPRSGRSCAGEGRLESRALHAPLRPLMPHADARSPVHLFVAQLEHPCLTDPGDIFRASGPASSGSHAGARGAEVQGWDGVSGKSSAPLPAPARLADHCGMDLSPQGLSPRMSREKE